MRYLSAIASLLGFLFLTACAVPAGNLRAPGLANFNRVDNRLYRGAQPDETGLRFLAGMGIKTVINLRLPEDCWTEEPGIARSIGLNYVSLPLHGLRAPSELQIAHALSLIETSPAPVFIHCRRGADRTGTVIACYRIMQEGWSGEAALAEAKRHGMAWGQFWMKDFITDFAIEKKGK